MPNDDPVSDDADADAEGLPQGNDPDPDVESETPQGGEPAEDPDERAARRTTIHGDTEVQVSEEEITVSGPDIEAVGQTAADIEQLTRVTDKDVRVFQDGVYITGKPARGDA